MGSLWLGQLLTYVFCIVLLGLGSGVNTGISVGTKVGVDAIAAADGEDGAVALDWQPDINKRIVKVTIIFFIFLLGLMSLGNRQLCPFGNYLNPGFAGQ